MQRLRDTVIDQHGNAVEGATVRVQTYPAGILATIYADSTGIVPKSNPLITDEDGAFEYYAADGRYSWVITTNTDQRTIDDVLMFSENPTGGSSVPVGSVDVTEFGALGNGVHDDTSAIAEAILDWRSKLSRTQAESGAFLIETAELVFPRGNSYGQYLVTETLNFSGIRFPGAAIRFDSSSLIGKTSGTPVVDAIDSQTLLWKYPIIQAPSLALAPSIGFLVARRADGRSADSHVYVRPHIEGHFTVANYYNYGSESNKVLYPSFSNLCPNGEPLIFYAVAENVAGVTSPYQTIASGTVSMNDLLMDSVNFSKQGGGAGYISRLDGIFGLYLTGYCSLVGASTAEAWHRLTSDTARDCRDIVIHTHHEGPDLVVPAAIILLDKTTNPINVKGLHISDYNPGGGSKCDALIGFKGACNSIYDLITNTPLLTTMKLFKSVSGGTLGTVSGAQINNLESTAQSGAVNTNEVSVFSGIIKTGFLEEVSGSTNTTGYLITTRKSMTMQGVLTLTIAGDVLTLLPTAETWIEMLGEGGIADNLTNVVDDGTGVIIKDGLQITISNSNAYGITLKDTDTAFGIRTASGGDIVLSKDQVAVFALKIGSVPGTTDRWKQVGGKAV